MGVLQLRPQETVLYRAPYDESMIVPVQSMVGAARAIATAGAKKA